MHVFDQRTSRVADSSHLIAETVAAFELAPPPSAPGAPVLEPPPSVPVAPRAARVDADST